MKRKSDLEANLPHSSDAAMLDQDPPIATNDTPKPGWFKVGNDFYRSGLAAEIGPDAVAVYQAIRLHANQKTGQAWPSYKTIQNLTGLSRTTVVKCVKKLKRLGLIRVENRKDQFGGRTSNMYTVLDISGGRNGAQNGVSGGASDVPGAGQGIDGGGTSSGSGPVRPTNVPRSQGVSKQHPDKHTQRESEERNETHHQHRWDDDDGLRSLLLSSDWVRERRLPEGQEMVQFKRFVAFAMLYYGIEEFDGPERYVASLDPEHLDRLGTILIVLWETDLARLFRLRNPAGFVRAKSVDDEWLRSLGATGMRFVWDGFCQQIAWCQIGPVSARPFVLWLEEKLIDFSILDNLKSAGFTFRWNHITEEKSSPNTPYSHERQRTTPEDDSLTTTNGNSATANDVDAPNNTASGSITWDDDDIPF